MLLVNLFGPPGSGKSTGAAYIFSQLKMAGVNCELVTEYAKDKVWEEAKEPFRNQAFIFGNQFYRISRVEDKVDVVITDSPVLLSLIYNVDRERLGKSFDETVINVHKSYKNQFNVFIQRTKQYNVTGRLQTEEESDEISNKIIDLLSKTYTPYYAISSKKEDYEEICKLILEELNKCK